MKLGPRTRKPGIVIARRTLLGSLAIGAWLPSKGADAREAVSIGDPPSGKALIVFYRRSEYPDSAISYGVREGKAELGRLSVGTYFVSIVDPGVHIYTVHAERHSDMRIRVEADEVYYVRFELDVGVILWQPTLTPAEAWQFDQLSDKLILSSPLRPSVDDTVP